VADHHTSRAWVRRSWPGWGQCSPSGVTPAYTQPGDSPGEGTRAWSTRIISPKVGDKSLLERQPTSGCRLYSAAISAHRAVCETSETGRSPQGAPSMKHLLPKSQTHRLRGGRTLSPGQRRRHAALGSHSWRPLWVVHCHPGSGARRSSIRPCDASRTVDGVNTCRMGTIRGA
jgi:hypothetical protein